MGRIFEPHIALHVLEMTDRISAVGVLAAIQAAAGKQAGQFGDGDAVQLMLENMIDALLQIGDFVLQPHQQALGDFPQEHAAFAGGV